MAIGPALLGMVVALVASCSLLFEAPSAASSELDASAPAPDSNRGDASAATPCGPVFGDTLSHFVVDGATNELADQKSDESAELWMLDAGTNLDVADKAPLVTGPAGCGQAMLLEEEKTTFAKLRHDRFQPTLSIDFWFRVTKLIAGSRGGLLTKDRSGANLGDLGFFIMQASEENG